MQELKALLEDFDYIVICGPTACGKTGLYEELAKIINLRCINADTGQMYKEVGVGTAKPELDSSLYCFDILSLGQSTNAASFKNEFLNLKKEIRDLGAKPAVVGGSFFYIQSLFYEFFSQAALRGDRSSSRDLYANQSTQELYKKLLDVDPSRAKKIEQNDRYRIIRALDIWDCTGILPSECAPKFNNNDNVLIVYIDPGQKVLDQRISLRLDIMLKTGWIEEVRALKTEQRKLLESSSGFIGYKQICEFLEGKLTLGECRDMIFYQTRNYAKRQRKFFKMFERKIKEDNSAKNLKIVKLDRGEVGLLSNCIKHREV